MTLRPNMVNIIHTADDDDKKANPMRKMKHVNFSYRFDCVAEGNPAPSVFWTKEVSWKRSSIWLGKSFILYPPQGNQDLVFAGTSHGTLHVSPQGSLSIQVLQSLLSLEPLHSFQPSWYCHQVISRAFVWRTRGSLCVRPFLWRDPLPRRLTSRSLLLAMNPLQSFG